MGNPAGGLLLLLLGLYLLLAFFSGRLEWLFRIRSAAAASGPGAAPQPVTRRPSTVIRAG
jgi:uncharacterized iron-regulated membrane protein